MYQRVPFFGHVGRVTTDVFYGAIFNVKKTTTAKTVAIKRTVRCVPHPPPGPIFKAQAARGVSAPTRGGVGKIPSRRAVQKRVVWFLALSHWLLLESSAGGHENEGTRSHAMPPIAASRGVHTLFTVETLAKVKHNAIWC